MTHTSLTKDNPTPIPYPSSSEQGQSIRMHPELELRDNATTVIEQQYRECT